MASPLVTRMSGIGTSIFTEMTQRAMAFDTVNLGQGFPDSDTPLVIKEVAIKAIHDGVNQYPPARGMPILREAVAAHQGRFYGLAVDPQTQVLVTVGATEALATAVLALVEPGEEVVTFDPTYDAYPAAIALAGAIHRSVPLSFPDHAFDPEHLAAAVTSRTRMIILNNPHNPTGKVFTAVELEHIADIARRNDIIVASDEVYEHLVFDSLVHTPIASLPGMAERTLTISSGGKTFSATGWKVGWVHGPSGLIDAIAAVKQFVTFAGSAAFQPAIAFGLGLPDAFFDDLASNLQRRRDLLVGSLRALDLAVAPTQGTYFVVADVRNLGVSDATQWCRDLPETAGLAAIPVAAFCADAGLAPTLVRFAFCKDDAVLHEGVRRLEVLGEAARSASGPVAP